MLCDYHIDIQTVQLIAGWSSLDQMGACARWAALLLPEFARATQGRHDSETTA
jgi:hypothetical protein